MLCCYALSCVVVFVLFHVVVCLFVCFGLRCYVLCCVAVCVFALLGVDLMCVVVFCFVALMLL